MGLILTHTLPLVYGAQKIMFNVNKISRAIIMKAAIMTATGESDVLELADLPTPEISAPDQVLVQLRAAGINPVDIKMREGFYNINPLPFTLGWDGAGVVEAVGDKVTHVKPGDEVVVFYLSFGDSPGD
jgi:NADPH2:quinone reductase